MTKIFLFSIILSFSFSAKGQVSDTLGNQKTNITLICKSTYRENQPLYILLLGEDQIQIDNLKNFTPTLDPNWIDNLNVLKKEIAIEKYGAKAENGVVLIKIKKENLIEFKDLISGTP